MHLSIAAETIFRIAGWPITNSMLLAFVSFGILALSAFALRRRLALAPGGLQSGFEMLLEFILGLMEPMFGDRRHAERYLPLVATVFLFILLSNWLGLFPFVGSIGFFHAPEHVSGHGEESSVFVLTPLFRAPAADLNFTLALAVISVLSVNVLGAAAIGTGKHFGKFFHFGNPIKMFVGLLEFIAEFVRMVSLSFRLFGNVFAGEVLLTVIASLVPLVIPLPFLFFEILVGFVQAFVFTLLTLVFLAMSVRETEGH